MTHLEVKRQMGQGDIEAVSELLAIAMAADGHAPIGEHRWLDLVHGGRESFAGLVAWETGHDHPVGFAQLSRRAGPSLNWEIEYVVDPHHRDGEPPVDRTLLAAALEEISREGGGHVHLWVPHPTPAHHRLASDAGLTPGRELRQLRLALPAGESSALAVRPFQPGRDEQEWLDVNNRAFRWHPEQGGWDIDTIRSRQGEAWFDPAGFLLHERDGKLAGFCWTKVHHEVDPPIGEIYVLAVDPAVQQSGLGTELALAGLHWLSKQGLGTAMLYVDADNRAAIRLYEKLGFRLDHVDQAFVGDVVQAKAPTPATEPRA